MTWVKMPIQEQWEDSSGNPASGYVIKAYLPGTTTVTPMAIDKNGTTTVTSVTLNANGVPAVSGNQVVLYIDREFKYGVFADSTAAAANSSPTYGFYDNVKIDAFISGNYSSIVDDYTELLALDPDDFTVGDIVYVTDNGIAGQFVVTTGSATDNGGTIKTNATWNSSSKHFKRIGHEFVTPDMFGVGSDANYTTQMQNFLNYIRDTGSSGKGTGATYRCDGVITLQSTSTSVKNYVIDWCGSTIDFSNTALTTGDMFTIGATSQANGHDSEMVKMANLKILGPESGSPYGGDTPTTSTVGLYMNYCLNYDISNIYIQGFYQGLNKEFCFPGKISRMEIKSCYIGAYIDSDTTECQWNQLSVTSAVYPLVIRPSGSGIVTGQCFYKPRFENCLVGPVLATDNSSANIAIRNVVFDEPYFESITYDLFRFNLNWTFSNPQTRNSDAPRDIIWCKTRGGVWGTGSWSGTRSPLVLASTATVIDCDFECGSDISNIVGNISASTYKSMYDVSIGGGSTYEEYNHRVTQQLNQHNFSAYLNAPVANQTGDGTVYTIIADTQDFDVGANYNNSTGVFTASIEGKYFLSAKVALAGLISSHTFARIRIVSTDKTVLKTMHPYNMADSNAEVVLELNDIFYLDDGDTAYVTIQISNGTKVVDINSSDTRFSGYFLG
jgi:hypothetical protein